MKKCKRKKERKGNKNHHVVKKKEVRLVKILRERMMGIYLLIFLSQQVKESNTASPTTPTPPRAPA